MVSMNFDGPNYSSGLAVAGLAAVFLSLCALIYLLDWRSRVRMRNRIAAALKKRSDANEKFRQENGYSWDFAIVFKVYREGESTTEAQERYSMAYILNRLSEGGIEFRLSYSAQHKEVFCKIRAPLPRLLKEASRIQFKLLTDEIELEILCEKGREGFWQPLKIPYISNETTIPPYKFIYIAYRYMETKPGDDDETLEWRKSVYKIYKKWPATTMMKDCSLSDTSEGLIFSSSNRLKLLRSILGDDRDGCRLDIDSLLARRCIKSFFPLHDYVHKLELEAEILTIFDLPWRIKTNEIKDYFGERVGLFYSLLKSYSTWALSAGLVSVAVYGYISRTQYDYNNQVIPFFAGFISMWASLFVNNWKKQESRISMEWGMVGFEDTEDDRPAFEGTELLSPVDGKPSKYFPRAELRRRQRESSLAMLLVLCVTIAFIAATSALRRELSNEKVIILNTPAATIVSSLALAVQIQVTAYFYRRFVIYLNDRENHRTDTDYEDALINKTFCLTALNNYGFLLYVAFFKPFTSEIDKCLGSCMQELGETVGTLFLARIVLTNLYEIGWPIFYNSARMSRARLALQVGRKATIERTGRGNSGSRREKGGKYRRVKRDSFHTNEDGDSERDDEDETKGFAPPSKALVDTTDLSEVEKEYLLSKIDAKLGIMGDYGSLVGQFGFCCMFAASFPLICCASFVSVYITQRILALKLCVLNQRIEPLSQEDIGSWQYVMDALVIFSKFINSGLVAFTGEFCTDYTWPQRVWIFALMSMGHFFVNEVAKFILTSRNPHIDIQLQRQEYISGKILDNQEDDDLDVSEFMGANRLYPKFTVKKKDTDPL